MRTVSTLCASGAAIGLASVGLTVVREETSSDVPYPSHPPSTPNLDMTTLASYPQLHTSPNFALPTPLSTRNLNDQHVKVRSAKAKTGQKRLLTPRASFQVGLEQVGSGRAGEDRVGLREGMIGTYAAVDRNGSGSGVATPGSRSSTWLRRLSGSMSTSRASTPPSRPGSAAVSQTNGSFTFSHTGYSTPSFPGNSSGSLPPNKLIKRDSSLRSSTGSSASNTGSRLPMPIFRRPATSRDRSISLQHVQSSADRSDRMSIDGVSSVAREPQVRQYFTPRVDAWAASRRRSTSSIPKPIKRVYPDRSYTPILVKATGNLWPAQVEEDGRESVEEATSQHVTDMASSPLPRLQDTATGDKGLRRSFSITELLSTGPQQLWKRPSQSQRRISGNKASRGRIGTRVVSAPQGDMGNAFSNHDRPSLERPAKRRNLSDLESPLQSAPVPRVDDQEQDVDMHQEVQLDLGTDTPHSRASQSPAADASSPYDRSIFQSQHRLPSASSLTAVARSARLSAARSEIASAIDSDSEYRSLGDDSTDYQSDALYDSYPTRTTRSSSGRRGPHIEKIFDESPPAFSSGRSTKLRDLLNDGDIAILDHELQYRPSTIHEEESTISTPVRSVRNISIASTPSAQPRMSRLAGSSPLQERAVPDIDEIDWDAFDGDPAPNGEVVQHVSETPSDRPTRTSPPFRFGESQELDSPLSDTTPLRQNGHNTDRANLFDWSESQLTSSANQSPPRPKTMHGKKHSDNRGSRAPARRIPSGMHARSHSVPVVPDVGGRRSNVVANKFGTWGVGSKPVTEEWDDAFDFDGLPSAIPENSEVDEQRSVSGHDMFVPQSIRQQQQNVVANIGLLRDWGLLIEELKELRIRAMALDMMHGPYASDWEEVDAMIELADQETDEETLEPRWTPPSSPGFDYTEFDDSSAAARGRGVSLRLSDAMMVEADPVSDPMQSGTHVGASNTVITSRARKDSEAVARSVIEALQSKRSVSDPTAAALAPQSRKVPFDTATLRHIVPYVDRLKRKVKEGLRETEGLRTSPHRGPPQPSAFEGMDEDGDEQPAFRNIFRDSRSDQGLAIRHSRREQAATDHDGSEDLLMGQGTDLAQRMRNMNLPR